MRGLFDLSSASNNVPSDVVPFNQARDLRRCISGEEKSYLILNELDETVI